VRSLVRCRVQIGEGPLLVVEGRGNARRRETRVVAEDVVDADVHGQSGRARSSPSGYDDVICSRWYSAPWSAGTAQPVGHIVRISTREKPSPASCDSNA